MKKILLICLVFILGSTVANAGSKKDTNLTTTVFVVDIDCENCVKKINNNVSALGKGIENVEVSLKAKEVEVTYNTKKNTDAGIIAGFKKIDVKASVKTQPKNTTPATPTTQNSKNTSKK
ncbi:MAG: heavy metal-associated domain-containing protein [Rikenellaceae bacterium]